MDMHPFLLCDFYKVGHPFQYPQGTNLVYSNFTPRGSRIKGIDRMVVFGYTYFIKEYMIDYFDRNFFKKDKAALRDEYKGVIKTALGTDLPSYDHIDALHDLQYLPIEIKALPEGSRVNMRVPFLTIRNTLPEFYWLTNFFETLISAIIWQPCTSATIAYEYRQILNKYARETGMPDSFVEFQGHDFSFRGLPALEAAMLSGAGHLLSFSGTDTIPAIQFLKKYYGAEGFIGGSIPATEHSVMCAGGKGSEIETFKRLLTEIYPQGLVSVVSDTWDLWQVIDKYLPMLKDIIMEREGKLVIRPDSGDPEHIIGGYRDDELELVNDDMFHFLVDEQGRFKVRGKDKWITETERKGVIEALHDIFGGAYTNQHYKILNTHIGAIYGDSITLEICRKSCQRLKDKNFASQCVFGIGSFTYTGGGFQDDKPYFITRDTFGLAMKATYVEVKGEGIEIFKDPVTDDGLKKSAKGLLKVLNVGQVEPASNRFKTTHFELVDQVPWDQEKGGALETVFKDGKLVKDCTLDQIKRRLHS